MAARPPSAPPPSPEDPIVEAHIERALESYKALLPAEDVAVFREMLHLYLTTHPDVTPLLNQLRARSAVTSSATVPKEGAVAVEEAVTRSIAKKGTANGRARRRR